MFNLGHHRTPNTPGNTWQRLFKYEEMLSLPLKVVAAFEHIEIETYLLARDIQGGKRTTEP